VRLSADLFSSAFFDILQNPRRIRMPHRFRTLDGRECKPQQLIPLVLEEGSYAHGTWAGSATVEKLTWWTRPGSGNVLTQSLDIVTEIAQKDDSTGELVWGPLPQDTRLFFVLEAPSPGKNYRLARLLTTAATNPEIAYYNHPRAPFLGRWEDGSLIEMPPLATFPSRSRRPEPTSAQTELF